MNHWMIILFVGLNSTLHSQPDAGLLKALRLMADSAAFRPDTNGISSFSNIPHPCSDQIIWDSYHVTDLNADGLNDLIFSGSCMPYLETIVYMNTGNDLKPVFEYAGRPVSVENFSQSSRIYILKASCCCDRYSELIELEINKSSAVKKRIIYFHPDTEISIGRTHKILVFNGILRTTPRIDNLERLDECTDDIIEGNKLLSIGKDAEVIQVSRKKAWKLVLFRENDENYWLGWVK